MVEHRDALAFFFAATGSSLSSDHLAAAARQNAANGPQTRLDPFTGEPIEVRAAVRLCAFWRDLIDGNRDISAALGFAFWKRPTVAPLLWAGEAVPFVSDLKGAPAGAVAIWKSRTPLQMALALALLGQRGPGSVVGGRAPASPASAPAAPAPAQPAK